MIEEREYSALECLEQALHVLEIPREHDRMKAIDANVARQWLMRGIKALIAYGDARERAGLERIHQVVSDGQEIADRAYCTSLDIARTKECLGWEAKARLGEFGKAEYEAHKRSHEEYGRHLGASAVLRLMREALPVPAPDAGEKEAKNAES